MKKHKLSKLFLSIASLTITPIVIAVSCSPKIKEEAKPVDLNSPKMQVTKTTPTHPIEKPKPNNPQSQNLPIKNNPNPSDEKNKPDKVDYSNALVKKPNISDQVIYNKILEKPFKGLQRYKDPDFIGIAGGGNGTDNQLFSVRDGLDISKLTSDGKEETKSNRVFDKSTWDPKTKTITFKYMVIGYTMQYSQTITLTNIVEKTSEQNPNNQTETNIDYSNALVKKPNISDQMIYDKILKKPFKGLQRYKDPDFIGIAGGGNGTDNQLFDVRDGLDITKLTSDGNPETKDNRKFLNSTWDPATKTITFKYMVIGGKTEYTQIIKLNNITEPSTKDNGQPTNKNGTSAPKPDLDKTKQETQSSEQKPTSGARSSTPPKTPITSETDEDKKTNKSENTEPLSYENALEKLPNVTDEKIYNKIKERLSTKKNVFPGLQRYKETKAGKAENSTYFFGIATGGTSDDNKLFKTKDGLDPLKLKDIPKTQTSETKKTRKKGRNKHNNNVFESSIWNEEDKTLTFRYIVDGKNKTYEQKIKLNITTQEQDPKNPNTSQTNNTPSDKGNQKTNSTGKTEEKVSSAETKQQNTEHQDSSREESPNDVNSKTDNEPKTTDSTKTPQGKPNSSDTTNPKTESDSPKNSTQPTGNSDSEQKNNNEQNIQSGSGETVHETPPAPAALKTEKPNANAQTTSSETSKNQPENSEPTSNDNTNDQSAKTPTKENNQKDTPSEEPTLKSSESQPRVVASQNNQPNPNENHEQQHEQNQPSDSTQTGTPFNGTENPQEQPKLKTETLPKNNLTSEETSDNTKVVDGNESKNVDNENEEESPKQSEDTIKTAPLKLYDGVTKEKVKEQIQKALEKKIKTKKNKKFPGLQKYGTKGNEYVGISGMGRQNENKLFAFADASYANRITSKKSDAKKFTDSTWDPNTNTLTFKYHIDDDNKEYSQTFVLS
ncbi:hypothetical protein ACXYRR_00375 [Mycoplasma sp. 246B]